MGSRALGGGKRLNAIRAHKARVRRMVRCGVVLWSLGTATRGFSVITDCTEPKDWRHVSEGMRQTESAMCDI